MISTRWIDRRRPHWQRLDALLTQVSASGLSSLSRADLQDLGLLYRQTAADLASAREDPASARLADALNQLLARAHHTIYAANRPTTAGVWHFLRTGFPATVRQHAAHCVTAVSIFLVAAAAGAILTLQDPAFKAKVIGPQFVETIDRHEMWTHSIVAIKPLASSQIMTNNISVTFMAFASGITGGLLTVYLLLFNGLLISVVATACAQAGMSVSFWSFVAPHGALELPAIFISAAGGLRLGQGLLFPGLLPRRDSVARAGAEAVKLVLGCVPLLVVAGLIEAFVSPTELAIPLKFAFGAALFALLVWYIAPTRRF